MRRGASQVPERLGRLADGEASQPGTISARDAARRSARSEDACPRPGELPGFPPPPGGGSVPGVLGSGSGPGVRDGDGDGGAGQPPGRSGGLKTLLLEELPRGPAGPDLEDHRPPPAC